MVFYGTKSNVYRLGESLHREENALKIIKILRKEINVSATIERAAEEDTYLNEKHTGWYSYWMTADNGKKVLVETPGVPLNEVKYRKKDNTLDFYKIYVDGSSRIWEFGVQQINEMLQ